MASDKFRFGIIGLGTMGRNLLLNMADHGFAVAGYDKDGSKKNLLEQEGQEKEIRGFVSINDFVDSLKLPRVIMLLVPAGSIVDAVINDLQPLLSNGDIIIDGGNSHFTDTEERIKRLQSEGLHFMGMGISGGEEGARHGPSMMPGGDEVAYRSIQPVLEAITAKVHGESCVAYIGPGASGHFVKMVHNGIEYAIMQLIADTYEILKTVLRSDNKKIGTVFTNWHKGKLQSYLIEITADIFGYTNPDGTYLIDQIRDEAKAKGTGKWTTQISTDLELPIPTIDVAVATRDLSKYSSLRESASLVYPLKNAEENFSGQVSIDQLESACYFSMICIYAQGMHLLSRASSAYNYNLKLDEIAKIWRGGCIIRAELLNEIYKAYSNNSKLDHLLLDSNIQSLIKSNEDAARTITAQLLKTGVPIPAYVSAISYFDAIRSGRMPTNLIQAQRDYFGAHTYELIGKQGVFHTTWKRE